MKQFSKMSRVILIRLYIILEKLSKQFPEAVVANPVVNLLLLENPNSKFVKLTLARSNTTLKDKNQKIATIARNNLKKRQKANI